MSYEEPGATESFTIRLRKRVINQPSVKWYNTYECRFRGLGSSEDLDSLAVGLCVFESFLMIDAYMVDQYTISTWNEDSVPYNPQSFVTVPVSYQGERPLGAAVPADLRITLFLKRLVESGRIGRLFLRGCIFTNELSNFGGEFSFIDQSSFAQRVSDAMDAAGLAQNMEGGLSLLGLALIGNSQVTRFIQDFNLGGVSFVKLNHKYFDRV